MARGVIVEPHGKGMTLDPVGHIGVDVELQWKQAGRLGGDRSLRRIRIHHRNARGFPSGVPEPDLVTGEERDLDQSGENGD